MMAGVHRAARKSSRLGRVSRRLRKPLAAIAAISVVALTIVPITQASAEDAAPDVTTEHAAAPTLVSDLADYPPGGQVNLTGENWLPNAPVTIVVDDEIGRTWQLDTSKTANGDPKKVGQSAP